MSKKIFEDYRTGGGLTVGMLQKLLLNYPNDMKVTVRVLDEHFPARIVKEGDYKIYPFGCNGVAQGKEECLRIE
ncbi:hypothetical protein [Natronincola ferrireducens]|uniref:Uncharacterized protein n=1 Tax=Natronincola ferrireducens TaxID=393762 RepID=A0A1G9I3D9_9FIRM|nr:hypothetical protein [Natronincola ferrireducens]SDL19719.1 hypothetical protein SAMN05660472_02786 [Natronincola ferrireducens]